uniref:H15 domain-containing protein n=1 Tax=Clastoptera arizonana TaxID=38151 RepID=A0A1B6DAT4_9HEMI
MIFYSIEAINKSPEFLVRVLSALHDLGNCSECGSSAPEVVEYIKTNYDHDGDVVSQVTTALKKAVQRKIVKVDSGRKFTYVGYELKRSVNKNEGCNKIEKQTVRKCGKRKPKCRTERKRKCKPKIRSNNQIKSKLRKYERNGRTRQRVQGGRREKVIRKASNKKKTGGCRACPS